MLGGRPEVFENIFTMPLSLFPIFICQYPWSFLISFAFFRNPFKVDIFSFSFFLFLSLSFSISFYTCQKWQSSFIIRPRFPPVTVLTNHGKDIHTQTIKQKHNKQKAPGHSIFCSWFYHEIRNLHLLPLLLMVVVKGVVQ